MTKVYDRPTICGISYIAPPPPTAGASHVLAVSWSPGISPSRGPGVSDTRRVTDGVTRGCELGQNQSVVRTEIVPSRKVSWVCRDYRSRLSASPHELEGSQMNSTRLNTKVFEESIECHFGEPLFLRLSRQRPITEAEGILGDLCMKIEARFAY